MRGIKSNLKNTDLALILFAMLYIGIGIVLWFQHPRTFEEKPLLDHLEWYFFVVFVHPIYQIFLIAISIFSIIGVALLRSFGAEGL